MIKFNTKKLNTRALKEAIRFYKPANRDAIIRELVARGHRF